MSGLICEIIIRGNRTQAAAQSLCQLGTTSYDGEEIMTPSQQLEATQIMQAFNEKADALLKAILANP